MKSHFESTLREMRSKEIENLKLKLWSEYEDKFSKLKEEYNEKVIKHKKEIRAVLDQTVESLTKTYDDEIQTLKKKNKDNTSYISELKRSLLTKEADVLLLQERIKNYESEKQMKLQHADLLCQLTETLTNLTENSDSKDKLSRLKEQIQV